MAKTATASATDIIETWRADGIRYVRFELPDMHGTSRTKIVPIAQAAGYCEEGLNMYGGAAVLDSRSDVVPGDALPRGDRLRRPAPDPGSRDGRRRPVGRGDRAVHLRLAVHRRRAAARARPATSSAASSSAATTSATSPCSGSSPSSISCNPDGSPALHGLPDLQPGPEHVRPDDHRARRPHERVRDRDHHRQLRVRGLPVGDQLPPRGRAGGARQRLLVQERDRRRSPTTHGLNATFMSKPFADSAPAPAATPT